MGLAEARGMCLRKSTKFCCAKRQKAATTLLFDCLGGCVKWLDAGFGGVVLVFLIFCCCVFI